MSAPAPDRLQPLVAACHLAARRYEDAARAVGDPGLRLQFKHLATARGELGTALGVAAGVSAASIALGAPGPAVAPSSLAARPDPTARVPLGGEDEDRPLEKAELRALVQGLREHDEAMLADIRRLHENAVAEIAAALTRAAETLRADLEKMRILEDLTAALPHSVHTR